MDDPKYSSEGHVLVIGGAGIDVRISNGLRGAYVPDPVGADIPPLIIPTNCWVRRAAYDCDMDALLFVVEQEGQGACHTGERSCFFRDFGSGAVPGPV